MNNKDIEQKMQESVDGEEVRDFSLVWKDIKHEVQPPKKRRTMRWIPAVATVASAVIVGLVVLPFALQNGGNISGGDSSSDSTPIYLNNQLSTVATPVEEFFSQLSLAEIHIVDFSSYSIYDSYLSKTEEGEVKGGKVELTDDFDNSTFYLMLELYDESVKIEDEAEIVYDLNYSVNGATIEYRVKESYPEDSIYIYDIKANYNSVNYLMEYTCFTEDITVFLSEFFK